MFTYCHSKLSRQRGKQKAQATPAPPPGAAPALIHPLASMPVDQHHQEFDCRQEEAQQEDTGRRRRRRGAMKPKSHPTASPRATTMSRLAFYHHLPLVFLLVLVDHQHNLQHLHTSANLNPAQHTPMLVHALQHGPAGRQANPLPQMPAFTPSNRTASHSDHQYSAALAASSSSKQQASNHTAPSMTNTQQQASAQQQAAAASPSSNSAISRPQQPPPPPPAFSSRPPSFNPIGNLQREQINYKTTTTCEGNLMELACDEGKQIHLVRAIYGRFSLSICNEQAHSNYSVQCASFKSFLVLETRCNKLTSCNVTVSKDVFGDPCEGTAKYLEVQYNCVEGGQNNGQVITNPNTRQQQVDAVRLQPPLLAATATAAAPSGVHKSQAQQAGQVPLVGVDQQPTSRMQLNNGADQQQQAGTTTTSGNNISQDFFERQQQQQQQQQQASVILAAGQQQYCPGQASARGLYWNATRAGQVARQACPEGASGRPVSWLCDYERLRFVPHFGPDFSLCRSNWLARLGQQLDTMLELGAGASPARGAGARQQDEQMIRSILGELSLLARTKELFSEDLRRIDIMISQMIAQLRSYAVLAGASAPPPPLVSTFRELFAELASICSSLFDAFQRQAWLELGSHEARARLELRLLGHLREAGAMLAQSLSLEQLATLAPVRQPNILAGISVLPGDVWPSASGGGGQLELNQLSGPQDDAGASSQLWQDDGELRLPSQLLGALAANGFTKFLVLDVKKPDYSLMRMQLEQQQQAVAYADQQQQQQVDNQQQQQQQMLAAGDQPPQLATRRLFGVFAVHGETGELLGSGSSGDAAASPLQQQQQQDSIKRLGDLMAQWPISIEFKSQPAASGATGGGSASSTTQAGLGQPARQCHSLSSDTLGQSASSQPPTAAAAAADRAGNHCHLSKYNATTFVCSCDRFGFVALAQQFLQLGNGGYDGEASRQATQVGAFPWPPLGGPFGELPLAGDMQQQQQQQEGLATSTPFVVNRQPSQQSLGVISYIFIVFGLALMILSLSGLVLMAALRLRAHLRLSGKKHHQQQQQQQQSFFDSWRTMDGGPGGQTTTGPLSADHNLLASDPLVAGAASSSIVGLTGSGGSQQVLPVGAGNAQNTYKMHHHHHQLYAATGGAHSPMLDAYSAQARRAPWPARLVNWLLARPPRAHGWGWLSSSSGSASQTSSARSDGAKACGGGLMSPPVNHPRLAGNATHATLAYHKAPGQPYNNQNGYTTALGLHQHTMAAAASHQRPVPLGSNANPNNSSNSSYVSSSAYYEEIGPGNMTKVNPRQFAPHELHEHSLSGQQQQQQQAHNLHHPWQMTYAPQSQQQQQQVSLITKQHLHNDLSPLQSSSSSSAGSQHSAAAAAAANAANGMPRHYLFASPIAVNAYKQQQFRGHSHQQQQQQQAQQHHHNQV